MRPLICQSAALKPSCGAFAGQQQARLSPFGHPTPVEAMTAGVAKGARAKKEKRTKVASDRSPPPTLSAPAKSIDTSITGGGALTSRGLIGSPFILASRLRHTRGRNPSIRPPMEKPD
jgi:hypothetical protein